MRSRSLLLQCLVGAALLCAASAAAAAAVAKPEPVPVPPPAPSPASDEASSRFDGDWTLHIACAAAADAQAYAVEMPASILNGQLFASNGAQGLPGVMQVDGTVHADGRMQMQARGRTDDPAFVVGHPASGTAYAISAPVSFDPERGSGRFEQGRPCNVDFKPR